MFQILFCHLSHSQNRAAAGTIGQDIDCAQVSQRVNKSCEVNPRIKEYL